MDSAKSGGKKATRQKLSRHFKYLEHRPKDNEPDKEKREDRHIFNAEHDHITRSDAVDTVMSNTSYRAAYHHLILSPDPNEPISDLRQWTRDTMNDLAEAKGQTLTWYAVQHYNTEHPHVHIVIAGGTEIDGQEKREPVTIFHRDIETLHDIAYERSDHKLYKEMQELHRLDVMELEDIQHDLSVERER